MSEAGLLDAAFRASAVLAGAGALVCVGLAVRARLGGRDAATHELVWALVPSLLLAALLSLVGRV